MRYLVLTLLCLCAVVAYVQRSAISIPAAAIERDLGLSGAQMGLVMGAWYWAYALLQLPAGWFADRWGPRPTLAALCVLWSAVTGLVGLAGGFWGLLGLWSLMGAAQAGIFPCATKSIGQWFPGAGRASASGVLIFSQAVGFAVAPVVTAALLTVLSWPQAFALYALPGLLWAAAYGLLAVDPPGRDPAPAAPTDWTRLATSYPMILLCSQQFLRAAAMVFFFTWFPKFLQQTGGLSQEEAGRLTAWPGVGAMLGGLLGGLASDWVLRRTGNKRLSRQGVAVAGMVCCTGLTLGAYFVADVRQVVLLFALGAFAGTFGGVSGYSVAIDFGGRRVATVFGTMNMCGNIGAGLFPPLVGWAVDRTGSWDVAILGFAGLFAADAVLWALLNPKRPLFEDDE
jgi:MFS family permease